MVRPSLVPMTTFTFVRVLCYPNLGFFYRALLPAKLEAAIRVKVVEGCVGSVENGEQILAVARQSAEEALQELQAEKRRVQNEAAAKIQGQRPHPLGDPLDAHQQNRRGRGEPGGFRRGLPALTISKPLPLMDRERENDRWGLHTRETTWERSLWSGLFKQPIEKMAIPSSEGFCPADVGDGGQPAQVPQSREHRPLHHRWAWSLSRWALSSDNTGPSARATCAGWCTCTRKGLSTATSRAATFFITTSGTVKLASEKIEVVRPAWTKSPPVPPRGDPVPGRPARLSDI